MPKTLEEQIADRCIHFNGIMNKCCKVGINYDDVKVDRPFKFPCLKQGGECSKSQFPTEEEVKARVDEIEGTSIKTLTAYAAIKEHYTKTKEATGKVKCECGGELKYTVASSNKHIWAKCSKCSISFQE